MSETPDGRRIELYGSIGGGVEEAMTGAPRYSALVLSSGVLVIAILLFALALGMVLVPVLSCPEGCPPREMIQPCYFCNGFGRATVVQRWYHLQFEGQRERNFREMQM